MTCIVGIVDEENRRVIIGADSAGVYGDHITQRVDKKVYKVTNKAGNEAAVIGFSHSFRMGQLLRYKFTLPDHPPGMHTDEYMVTLFMEEVRSILKEGGYTTIESNTEKIGSFLVAYKGQLFEIGSDLQVGENIPGYATIGSGYEVAIGSLHATGLMKLEKHKRIRYALLAAEQYCTSVSRPFNIISYPMIEISARSTPKDK